MRPLDFPPLASECAHSRRHVPRCYRPCITPSCPPVSYSRNLVGLADVLIASTLQLTLTGRTSLIMVMLRLHHCQSFSASGSSALLTTVY